MSAIRERATDLPHPPRESEPSSPQTSYFGWQVERRFEEPQCFPDAPIPDVFNRVPATPRQILEVRGEQVIASTQAHISSDNPWAHLPRGAFTVENGVIVPYQDDAPTDTSRRSKEDLLAIAAKGDPIFSSVKRQRQSHRSRTNTRETTTHRPRGEYRPQQGSRR